MAGDKSFYIIDCSYHFRASFFALPPIYSPEGKLVNAVYGFVSVLLKLLKDRHPDALAVADDASGRYFRHELLPAYKSEKKRVPEECDRQMPILRRVLDVMGIPYLAAERFEADDVIATLTRIATQYGYHVYVCSKDKDLQQLLADDVTILDTTSGKEMTPATLKEAKGVSPEQIPDMLALTGDKVDSIPGIPGVGPKTAAKLLADYGSLESVLDHSTEIGGKLGQTIKANADGATLAKELILLHRNAPVDFEMEAFKVKLPGVDAVRPLFEEMGFQRLLGRLAAL